MWVENGEVAPWDSRSNLRVTPSLATTPVPHPFPALPQQNFPSPRTHSACPALPRGARSAATRGWKRGRKSLKSKNSKNHTKFRPSKAPIFQIFEHVLGFKMITICDGHPANCKWHKSGKALFVTRTQARHSLTTLSVCCYTRAGAPIRHIRRSSRYTSPLVEAQVKACNFVALTPPSPGSSTRTLPHHHHFQINARLTHFSVTI